MKNRMDSDPGGVDLEYTIRDDEEYNEVILNLRNSEVETGITDLRVFQ